MKYHKSHQHEKKNNKININFKIEYPVKVTTIKKDHVNGSKEERNGEKKNEKRYCSVIEQESQPPISTRQALHCVWCSDKENERVTQLQMRILHKKK